MRIGELLLLRDKVDPWLVSHTLKEQANAPAPGQRLVSLLVARAHLDLDEGALLLSEQLGYPAALQRHLERRDPEVLRMLPPELGSRWVVLPLARAHTGALVVVARDPAPILAAALEHAIGTPVILAVTPAVQLERMVRAAYGLPARSDIEPLPISPPTASDLGHPRPPRDDEIPLPLRRARTVSYVLRGGPPDLLHASHVAGPFADTLLAIDRAITVAAVERLVITYAATRWTSALLARIDVDASVATGMRGHATSPADAQGITIALSPGSMIALARETRRVITDAVAESQSSPARPALAAVLGGTVSAVAPVSVASSVTAVLAVGAPRAEVEAGADLVGELDRLVDALGAAYVRFARRD
jgi:hypothetical protein